MRVFAKKLEKQAKFSFQARSAEHSVFPDTKDFGMFFLQKNTMNRIWF